MVNDPSREVGLERLTEGAISLSNQHYIVTYFIRKDIEAAAAQFASGRLLDVGCGNKPYHSVFKHKVSDYVGCDIVQSSANVVDNLCPADDLCYDNDSFDTVFSTQVLEHVANFPGMLSESCRVLKAGGHAIFTVPFSWELHEEPYDFHRFSKWGLQDAFQKAGFEIIEIKPNGGKWAALAQLALNVLYSTRKYKTLRSRMIKLLFVRLRFIYIYNRFAIWLDKRYFDSILTLNYLVVAKKSL